MARSRQQGFRSFAEAAEPAKTVWTPVVNALPRYKSLEEKRRWEQAAEDNPRRESEPLGEWAQRVAIAAAPPIGDRDLPPGDRAEPGSDG